MGALGVALLASLVVLGAQAVVAEVRPIESGSMRPTLEPGERVLVVKAGLDPWNLPRGTVVVFDAEDLWARSDDPQGTVFVKRIIGVPGDHVRCCTSRGGLLLNGEPLAEPYLMDPRSDQQAFDVVVQPGHYWLMGDDRAASADSRAHLGDPGGGNVPASRMIGTVEAVAWPPGSVRRLAVRDVEEGPDGRVG